jgi:type VI secretion system secreted protein VgrG
MATTAPITFESALGGDLLFRDMAWTESLGSLPEGRVTLLSTKADIRSDQILGKAVSVKFEVAAGRFRYFNGHVTSFQRGGSTGRFFTYYATLHPWLWYLTRTADCRVFVDKDVIAIIKDVFAGKSCGEVVYALFGSDYPLQTHCVQFRETDFNFVARLMERHGIYYAFEYGADAKQTLHVFNSSAQHSADPHLDTLNYLPSGGRATATEGHLTQWESIQTIQSDQFALTDFHYERPHSPLSHITHPLRQQSSLGLEMFDSYYDAPSPSGGAGKSGTLYADVTAEQSGTQFDVYHGITNAYDLRIGRTLQVKMNADAAQNAKFLVTGATYALHYTGHESTEGDAAAHYECEFSAIPVAQSFRPAPRTPRPYINGPQLATVTGPAGEEIFTDALGRVKVVFHWDRYGLRQSDKYSGTAIAGDKVSCWVPVAQIWAGNNFGAMFIPRVRHEVIVEFLDGDPDRPIVTGRIYNQENPPPWALPDNKTQSGVLTRSSSGGVVSNANMLRFEDKKGAEQLSIHAEKDQDISVENDETHDVGRDRTKTIGRDETTDVKHDRTEHVGNDETVTIDVDRTHSVGKDESWTIGGQRTHSVAKNESISVGKNQDIQIGVDQSNDIGANRTLTVGGNQQVAVAKDESVNVDGKRSVNIGKDDNLAVGKNLHVEAQDSITLKTGDASLVMKKDGTIEIKGKDITITGSGKIGIKASSDLVLKGAKIAAN